MNNIKAANNKVELHGFEAACACWNWLAEYESKLSDFNDRYDFSYEKDKPILAVKAIIIARDFDTRDFTSVQKISHESMHFDGGNFRDGCTTLWFRHSVENYCRMYLCIPSGILPNTSRTILGSDFFVSIEFDENIDYYPYPRGFEAQDSFLQQHIDNRCLLLENLGKNRNFVFK